MKTVKSLSRKPLNGEALKREPLNRKNAGESHTIQPFNDSRTRFNVSTIHGFNGRALLNMKDAGARRKMLEATLAGKSFTAAGLTDAAGVMSHIAGAFVRRMVRIGAAKVIGRQKNFRQVDVYGVINRELIAAELRLLDAVEADPMAYTPARKAMCDLARRKAVFGMADAAESLPKMHPDSVLNVLKSLVNDGRLYRADNYQTKAVSDMRWSEKPVAIAESVTRRRGDAEEELSAVEKRYREFRSSFNTTLPSAYPGFTERECPTEN